MRDLLREPQYQETRADMGGGIIVGGESDTYSAERRSASEPVRDDGIITAEVGLEYSTAEKVGFMSAWIREISDLAKDIEDFPPENVFNTLANDKATLSIDWDKNRDVRLSWIRRTGEGETSESEEITDLTEIAEAFPLAVLETVFDRAKDLLKYHRKRQELRKGGPQPQRSESEA